MTSIVQGGCRDRATGKLYEFYGSKIFGSEERGYLLNEPGKEGAFFIEGDDVFKAHFEEVGDDVI